MSQVIEGNLDAHGLKFAVVCARFNSFITDRLLAGALDALKRSGANESDIEVVKVPGSWELPLIAKTLAEQKRHDAIVALGAVIRGETPHFDHVSAGDGVVDNWSGASFLPSLYPAVKNEPPKHTYIFIGFTDEEQAKSVRTLTCTA